LACPPAPAPIGPDLEVAMQEPPLSTPHLPVTTGVVRGLFRHFKTPSMEKYGVAAVVDPVSSLQPKPPLECKADEHDFKPIIEEIPQTPTIQAVTANSIPLDLIDDSRPSGVTVQRHQTQCETDDTPMRKWAQSKDQFLFNGEILSKTTRMGAKFLFDSGSSGNFINQELAETHELDIRPCEPRQVLVANNSTLTVRMKIGSLERFSGTAFSFVYSSTRY
jgi:hypothetical protein